MFGNSYLKWVVIIFSLGAVVSAIYTAIFNASPIVTIVLFLVALMLNIVDAILTKKDYEKNTKKINEEIEKYEKSIKKIKKKSRG